MERQMFTYDEGKVIWILLLTAVIFGLVKLNERYYAERKQMTPDERRREDEELRNPGTGDL
jgi:hypothetical protein